MLLIFPLVLYLPHLLLSGGQSLFLFRLPLIAVAIAYYSETSTISEMLAALKGLHFPDLVLLQLDITIKYIDVFGKQLMDLLKGIEARALVAIIVSGLEVISGEFYTLKPYAMVRN